MPQSYQASEYNSSFAIYMAMFFNMAYLLRHGPHFLLIETKHHLETTHLWIQPLGRSNIL